MITSLSNQKVKAIARLHNRKYRQTQYIIDDSAMIASALEAGVVDLIVKTGSCDISFSETLEVSDEVMKKLAYKDGVEAIAVCHKKEEEIETKRALLLDDLSDPKNIGMIIRAADAFGVDMIYLGLNCADIYHPKCLDEAKESLYHVAIIKKDLDIVIDDLKSRGFKIYSTGLYKDTKELYMTEAYDALAIIMGNEGHGIKERYYKIADEVVKIPMENIDSLNVAIACTIVLEYYANSKR